MKKLLTLSGLFGLLVTNLLFAYGSTPIPKSDSDAISVWNDSIPIVRAEIIDSTLRAWNDSIPIVRAEIIDSTLRVWNDSIPIVRAEIIDSTLRVWNDSVPRSRIRAYINGADSVIANDTVVVEFDAETFDLYNEWDAATNRRFTALKTGYYWVTSTVEATVTVEGFRLAIYVDGAAWAWGLKTRTDYGNLTVTITDLVYLVAGHYLDIRMTATVTVPLQTGTSRSYVSIHKAS